ncbi:putative Arginyl-tRNA synthetase, cytoplasmic [Amniculicola lignicola CBS 123094]|uniref:arginine--tRNA ligase n=1 Tax=Amniculicola lignicola CBS 123094 TaxID=1392246 RepID=A0A6A5WVD7_9PLEO|nr:putative Arginyl-tRNA synthetase, cytoplasmic [Amniculicola lignicola CBS 123094]
MDNLLETQLEKLQVEQPDFPECFPSLNPFDVYRIDIAQALSELSGVQPNTIYSLLQRTATLDKGDLLLPVPALRIKGEKPNVLASRWADQFPQSALVSKPTVDGPFMQFHFTPSALVKRVIPSVLQNRSRWGSNPLLGLKDVKDTSKGQKRVVVEFSSPNIAKPFHQGHLRSTIIGGFISNLYQAAGWDVVRLNYLGDWGKQYGLLALGYKMYGDDKALEADPIHHLYQIYVKINSLLADERKEIEQLEKDAKDATKLRNEGLDEQARKYFKAMCDNDPDAISMWKKFRELSIQRYKEAYTRLNIHFDEYAGESLVQEGSMEIAQSQMDSKGLIEESQGAAIVDFSKHVNGKPGKALGKALIRKTDGTSLYLTRDIGALFERDAKYKFDQMIYVVATDQELHLKQLFKLVELTGNDGLRSRISHVSFGLVLGMSTRRGTVVFLDDVLKDVGEKMHDVMRKNEAKYAQVLDPEKTADILGISSVMVQDMSGKRINNYRFNMDTMTSFEGDTGPYLQYSHARLCSILLKAGIPASEMESSNLDLLTERHAINVVRLIAQFPDTFQNALKTLEPTTILTYLFRLTHAVNSSYDVLQVVGSERELMKARVALYEAARSVINNGMRLLGLTPLDR